MWLDIKRRMAIVIALAICFGSLSGGTATASDHVDVENGKMSTADDSRVSEAPGFKFQECPECPEMIVVPPGHFIVGRKAITHFQEPVSGIGATISEHEVTIDRPFAVAVYDVTRDEYAEFVRDSGRTIPEGCYTWAGFEWINDKERDWRRPGFRQTGRDPVVCVSWDDAQAYVRWLNSKILNAANLDGQGPYRLPSWEEAEYSARGGSTTSYSWGDEPLRDRANYGKDDCSPCGPAKGGGDHWLYTSPVGSFPPNGFGLFDTAGNVWQWSDDALPKKARTDGRQTGFQVGGSWLDTPEYLRIARFRGNDRINRNNAEGFRVVRDLDRTIGALTYRELPRKVTPPVGDVSGPGASDRAPGTKFRDCAACPEMIVIPPGRLTKDMFFSSPTAAQSTADDVPDEVKIAKPFALGVYHVTRGEYAVFVQATGHGVDGGCQLLDSAGMWVASAKLDWRNPGFSQTDRDPVVCVSWEDAQAYVHWLNTKVHSTERTGSSSEAGPYRLLSLTEWLYAARGGISSPSRFYWGHEPDHDYANYGLDECWPCGLAKQGRDHWKYTSPVGSFPPNGFGLYDIVGNVYQWTDDCFRKKDNVTTNGSPWTDGDCSIRILRGGAFDDNGGAALEIGKIGGNPYPIQARNYANGFRVAKTLD